MSQPPDDRHRLPWETDPSEASDQPTVSWTPPPPGQAPAPGAGPAPGWGSGATPPAATTPAIQPPAAEPSLDATPAVGESPPDATPTAEPPPLTDPSITPPPAPPATGPLLSSAPSAPVVGWQQPTSVAEAAPIEGHVIAGPWARLVAWWVDQALVTYLPSLLFVFVIDWRALFEAIIEQSQNPTTAQTFDMPFTTGYGIATVILVGVSYLYYVGFWTGPGRATPGMRVMKMQVTDEHLGATMTIGQATRRWFAMGVWLSLVAFLGTAGSIAGVVQPLLYIALFLSVIVNARRQGLHDRFAGSIVIRQRASGDGAVALGCVLIVALTIVIGIVFLVLFTTAVMPGLGPLLDDLEFPR